MTAAEASREATGYPTLPSFSKAANLLRQVGKGQAISAPRAEIPDLMSALFQGLGLLPWGGEQKVEDRQTGSSEDEDGQ